MEERMRNGKKSLMGEIGQYWTRRAQSYSDVVKYEMSHDNEKKWMDVITNEIPCSKYPRVLDIGTGPGFFATGLAKRKYDVTAVDYTEAMLAEAIKNAGVYSEKIKYCRMDAQKLDFNGGQFDAVVTRNLTWNLEDPQKAYAEWYRVLRTGGILLNFDAGWYSYLFNTKKADEFNKDRRKVEETGVFDYNDYSESAKMEEISRKLILSRCTRPETDIEMLKLAGFTEISVNIEIGKKVWDEVEKINYRSTPLFLIKAEK
jgi:ubiquinone/menaquinone biosynthesis C-methylase UbiE